MTWPKVVDVAPVLKHAGRVAGCQTLYFTSKIQTAPKTNSFLGLLELTLHIIICFPTGDPLSSLKAPVVRIRQNNFHKDVVMSREVETGDVETEEWEHASAQGKEGREKELWTQL